MARRELDLRGLGRSHGTYLVASLLFARARVALVALSGLDRMPYVHQALRRVVTFHLVLISWVFFRAASFSDAASALNGVLTNRAGQSLSLDLLGGNTIVALSIGALMVCELLQSRVNLRGFISRRPAIVRWPV